MIGNDIIDLQYFEWPPYQHIGYLERICTSGEAGAVRGSSNPARSLAAVWAAKEAAYKLTTRASNLTHFMPREFVTDFAHRNSQPSCDELCVSHHGVEVSVSIFETAEWLLGVARSPRCGNLQWRVRQIDNGPGQEIVPAVESATARQLAKELLQECGMKDLALEFIGRVPTLRNTGPFDDEKFISLSHHGRFVAAAIAWTSTELYAQEENTSDLALSVSSGAA